MGCTLSGLTAIVEAVSSGQEIWINERRFKILRQIGEGGFAFVYLVKEQTKDLPQEKPGEQLHVADDGMYAVKKVLIQSEEQRATVKQEIAAASRFRHPNLLPLLEHAVIKGKSTSEGGLVEEAYLLFPVHLDGTLMDKVEVLRQQQKFMAAPLVLEVFRQICAGLQQMHASDPPYAHNDVKPHNVLLSGNKVSKVSAVLMDFGSAAPARREIRSRAQALALQEWAAQNCSAPYRAPELWDVPSNCNVDERTDVWSLGCTLFAMMYGVSPFEHIVGNGGGSLQLAILSGKLQWPPGPQTPYPPAFQQLVTWMLQTEVALRPNSADVLLHVEKLIAASAPPPSNSEVNQA